jgi:serine/threonine protein kinase
VCPVQAHDRRDGRCQRLPRLAERPRRSAQDLSSPNTCPTAPLVTASCAKAVPGWSWANIRISSAAKMLSHRPNRFFSAVEFIVKDEGREDASLRSSLGQSLAARNRFTLQIARGLAHATQKLPGFVHRDLKPENIPVGSDPPCNRQHKKLFVFATRPISHWRVNSLISDSMRRSAQFWHGSEKLKKWT